MQINFYRTLWNVPYHARDHTEWDFDHLKIRIMINRVAKYERESEFYKDCEIVQVMMVNRGLLNIYGSLLEI